MPSIHRRNLIAQHLQEMPKIDLFIHFIAALRNESYLYASLLRDEIKLRTFTIQEVKALQNSSFYCQLNGVLDES